MAAALRTPRLPVSAAFGLLAAGVGVLAGVSPPFAIAAALGLAFMLVVLSNLYAGLVLFVSLSFIVEVPGLSGSAVTFSKFLGLLLAISWFAAITRRGSRSDAFPIAHPGATFLLVMFLGWITLSQLWAAETAPALDMAFRLSLNAFLVLIIFTAVRTPDQAIGVAGAFLAGAAVNAIYGLLFVTPEGSEEAARLASGLSNPNGLATVLVAALALGLGLAAALQKSPLARLGALCATALCAVGIFLTGSRGGLVALAVALLAFLLTGSRFRGRLILVTLALVAAGFGYYSYVASPEARERFSDIESGTGRTDLWQIGWRMVEAEPVNGIGGGNFPTSSVSYLFEPGAIERSDLFIGEPKVVHNTYLEVWAELGTVGLVLFLLVLGFGVFAGAQAVRTFASQGDQRMQVIARAVLVALAAVLAAAFFGSRQYNKELWILLGLAPALWAIARERGDVETG